MDCSKLNCIKTGYFSKEQIKFPSGERMRKKAVAVIECCQEIPCNPCMEYCPFGAIKVEDNINAEPTIDFEKCNGCGICLGFCPGLAIFMIDLSKDYGVVTIPYEIEPPGEGEKVDLLDRAGNVVGEGEIEKVKKPKQHDRTLSISLKMEKELVKIVRGFRSKK
jgi:Fe-S-cluster-containing hydrogenase component 2